MFTADLKTFSEQAKVKKVVAKVETEEKLPMENGVNSTVKTEVKVEEETGLSTKVMEEPSGVPIDDATEEADAKPVTKKQRRK
ncbi:hypothetical protein KEM55_001048 [Ascosphaera atra]|nr:hypothetical protein KEM55_001048 [Ascosphaera atra]